MLKEFLEDVMLQMKLAGVGTGEGAASGAAGPAAAAAGGSLLTGPDWTVLPARRDSETLELPKITGDSFDRSNVLYKVKAQLKLPEVIVMKDYKVYLHLDEGVNAVPLNLEPCELWGFNYGEFKTDAVATVRSGGPGLRCILRNPTYMFIIFK